MNYFLKHFVISNFLYLVLVVEACCILLDHCSMNDSLLSWCTFRIFGGVASRVPWGWRDSYGKTGNFGRVSGKSMFKMCKKAGVGREGDI